MKTIKKLMILSVLCAHIVAVEQTPERFNECEDTRTALIAAMEYSFQGVEPKKSLLQNFTNCGQENSHHRRKLNDAQTLLDKAMRCSGVDFVKSVLDSGANPNEEDEIIGLPLFFACRERNYKLLDLLLASNIDINSRNQGGQTAGFTACHSYSPSSSLKSASVEVLKILHEAGLDLNAQDYRGNTLLHESVISNGENTDAFIEYLIDQKVDLHVKNKNGNTALQKLINHIIYYGGDSGKFHLPNKKTNQVIRILVNASDFIWSDLTDEEKAELYKIVPELKVREQE